MPTSDNLDCKESDKSFPSGSEPFVCPICNKSFKNKHYISRHIATVHKQERNYPCNVCDKTYTDPTPLRIHKELHMADFSKKKFDCMTCGSSYYTKYSLEAHIRRVHNKTVVPCEICGVVTDKYSYKTHYQRHIDIDAKKYQCDKCSKICGSEKELKSHYEIHGDKEKVYKCDDCDKIYSRNEYLKKHIRYKHRNSEKGKWHCTICNKYFAQSGVLHNHLRIHRGNTYECSICDKKFTAKSNLKMHIYLHTGKMPFKCDLCDKSYRAKTELKVHRDYKHFNVKPFMCDLCDKGYIVQSDLRRHIKGCHPQIQLKPQ